MNNPIKHVAVYILVISVSVLTLMAVLSIWDVFSKDVMWKALSTIGIIGFGALIVVIASQVLEDKKHPPQPPVGMQ